MRYLPNANQGSVLRCLVGILFVQDVQTVLHAWKQSIRRDTITHM